MPGEPDYQHVRARFALLDAAVHSRSASMSASFEFSGLPSTVSGPVFRGRLSASCCPKK